MKIVQIDGIYVFPQNYFFCYMMLQTQKNHSFNFNPYAYMQYNAIIQKLAIR